MKKISILLLSLLSIILVGCSESHPVEPAPLVKFEQSVGIAHVWSTSVGKDNEKLGIKLQPLLDDDTLYTAGSNGRVSAVNFESGKINWQSDYKLPLTSGVGNGDGVLYIGTQDGEVIKLNKADGTLAWKVDVASTVIAAPQAQNNVVLVKTINGELEAINASSGQPMWNVDQPTPPLILRDASSATFSDGSAIVGFASGVLMSVDLKTGQPKWSIPLSISKGRTDVERMIDIDATPIVQGSSLFAATYQGELASLNPTTGAAYWKQKLSVYDSLASDSSNIYASDSNSAVWAFSQDTGRALWKQTALKNRQLTGPAVVGKYIAVGDKEGYLHILDKSDGHFVARIKISGSGISATPLVKDNIIVVLANNGSLYAYRIG